MYQKILFSSFALILFLLPTNSSADSSCNNFNQTLAGGVCIEESDLLGALALPYLNNEIVGIHLFKIKPDSVLAKRGFKTGDVLLKLNNQLANKMKLAQIRSELGESNSQKACTAEIRRLASSETIDCSLKSGKK